MSKSAPINSDRAAAFPFERYEGKCDKCASPLKIILGIITLLGIALALTAHFAPLNRAFVYLGATLSVAALIAVTVLFRAQKNNLRTALDAVRSFAELKAIVDTATVIHQRWYRCNCGENDDLEIRSSRLSGMVFSSELHNKMENMLRKPQTPFNVAEKQLAQQVTVYLKEKYKSLHSNERAFIPDVEKYL